MGDDALTRTRIMPWQLGKHRGVQRRSESYPDRLGRIADEASAQQSGRNPQEPFLPHFPGLSPTVMTISRRAPARINLVFTGFPITPESENDCKSSICSSWAFPSPTR